MPIFSFDRTIDTDLKSVSLQDILQKMESEQFFGTESDFYFLRSDHAQHLLLGRPRDRVVPKQTYEFEYKEKEQKIHIKSRFDTRFPRAILMYLLPISFLILSWNELTPKIWWSFIGMILVFTIFIILSFYLSLRAGSQEIERAIVIRLNNILRSRGFQVPL